MIPSSTQRPPVRCAPLAGGVKNLHPTTPHGISSRPFSSKPSSPTPVAKGFACSRREIMVWNPGLGRARPAIGKIAQTTNLHPPLGGRPALLGTMFGGMTRPHKRGLPLDRKRRTGKSEGNGRSPQLRWLEPGPEYDHLPALEGLILLEAKGYGEQPNLPAQNSYACARVLLRGGARTTSPTVRIYCLRNPE